MTDLATTPGGPLADRITYARALAASTLLPDVYRDKPANVLIALELGAALGLAPTTALYGINVIKGRPTLAAETMRAVVLAHGHRFAVLAYTEEEAVVEVARRERPDDTSTFAFTMEDARRAGLTGENYTRHPKAMLLARATSAACRALFPDVLAGVSYTPDELEEATPAPRVARLEVVEVVSPGLLEPEEAEVVEESTADEEVVVGLPDPEEHADEVVEVVEVVRPRTRLPLEEQVDRAKAKTMAFGRLRAAVGGAYGAMRQEAARILDRDPETLPLGDLTREEYLTIADALEGAE